MLIVCATLAYLVHISFALLVGSACSTAFYCDLVFVAWQNLAAACGSKFSSFSQPDSPTVLINQRWVPSVRREDNDPGLAGNSTCHKPTSTKESSKCMKNSLVQSTHGN